MNDFNKCLYSIEDYKGEHINRDHKWVSGISILIIESLYYKVNNLLSVSCKYDITVEIKLPQRNKKYSCKYIYKYIEYDSSFLFSEQLFDIFI